LNRLLKNLYRRKPLTWSVLVWFATIYAPGVLVQESLHIDVDKVFSVVLTCLEDGELSRTGSDASNALTSSAIPSKEALSRACMGQESRRSGLPMGVLLLVSSTSRKDHLI
jgi:hypothetical protein